jgi:hypothetical protein
MCAMNGLDLCQLPAGMADFSRSRFAHLEHLLAFDLRARATRDKNYQQKQLFGGGANGRLDLEKRKNP